MKHRPANLHQDAIRCIKLSVITSARMVEQRQQEIAELRTPDLNKQHFGRGNHWRNELTAKCENLVYWECQAEATADWKALIDSFTE